jgi:hypothetical protein
MDAKTGRIKLDSKPRLLVLNPSSGFGCSFGGGGGGVEENVRVAAHVADVVRILVCSNTKRRDDDNDNEKEDILPRIIFELFMSLPNFF